MALKLGLQLGYWQAQPPTNHVELARAVSAVARAHGAISDRAAVQEVQLAIAAKPGSLDVGFWRAALGYQPQNEDNATDPLGHGSTVWMQGLDEAKPLRHAMHIDVSVAREHVRARLEAALRVDRPRRPTKPTKASVERRLDAKKRQSARKAQRRAPHAE